MAVRGHPDVTRQVRFRDRQLAEAVRAYEAAAGPAAGAPAAEAAARQAGGELEQRVVVRATELPAASELRAALVQLRRLGGWAVAVGVVVWALLGAGAARGALEIGPGEAVNVFAVLAVLLGLQTLLLVGWLLMMVVWPRGAGQSSLGAKVVAAGQWLTGRLHRGDMALAATDAAGTVLIRSRVGPWLFGGISHAMWLSFNVACLATLAGLLSVRAYVFAWETTILTPEVYVRVTAMLGGAPAWLGMSTPSAGQVLATQATEADMLDREALVAARDAWAELLLGAVLVYGLLPRLVLTLACAMLAWLARQRYRLDLDEPYYRRLRDRLMPNVRSLGVVEPADTEVRMESPSSTQRALEQRAAGPPAIVAIEVRSHEGPWPPPVDGVVWHDLGFVDDRGGRQRVLDELSQGEVEPAALVIVCELLATPDRGTERYLAALRRSVGRPPVLLLTGGQTVRDRGGAAMVERRLSQWRELAARIGMDEKQVLDLDLDHATETSRAGLAELLPRESAGESAAAPAAGGRHLEAAFEAIVTHCRQWSGVPDISARTKLHYDIASLYRHDSDPRTWRKLLELPGDVRGDWQAKVRASARRAVSLLPPGLRLRPRWLAAGAASGALGCVAAATLLSPMAIAALPTWSIIGAAVAGAMQPRSSKQTEPSTAEAEAALQSDDVTEAVDAAALFAMLLQLQGRGEATISRVLDRVLADVDDAHRLGDCDDVQRWLDTLRHRFDMALTAEVRP